VKSTTKAQDGLYVYDTVQRLYDSRFGDGDVRDIRRYIKLDPLGEAFAAKQRPVLLISCERPSAGADPELPIRSLSACLIALNEERLRGFQVRPRAEPRRRPSRQIR